MPRLALLLLPALLAACTAPLGSPWGTPLATPQQAARDTRADACRAEATRVVQFRERAQTMRSDETESGRGTVTVAPFARAESDRMMAQMERDRMVQDCLRATPDGALR